MYTIDSNLWQIIDDDTGLPINYTYDLFFDKYVDENTGLYITIDD